MTRSADGTKKSEAAQIRAIIQDQTEAWNRGDAAAYGQHFGEHGTLTNIRGQFIIGRDEFVKQHELIFLGLFRNTTLQQKVVSLQFPGAETAVVETLTAVSGMAQGAPGMILDDKGRLRTRLLQVVARVKGEWKVVAYHNVDIKPGVRIPE